MVRYFDSLTHKEQWKYALSYHKAAEQLVSEKYLIEQLKWILKWPDFELEYSLFIQFMLDEEQDSYDVFKPGYFECWYDKYNQRFEAEFSELFEALEVSEESSDDSTDGLLF